MNMFKGLDSIAFWVMRLVENPEHAAYIKGGYAWAQAVRTGFPNYTEVWAVRR